MCLKFRWNIFLQIIFVLLFHFIRLSLTRGLFACLSATFSSVNSSTWENNREEGSLKADFHRPQARAGAWSPGGKWSQCWALPGRRRWRGAGPPGDCNPGVCWDLLSTTDQLPVTPAWVMEPSHTPLTHPPFLQVHHHVVIIMMEFDSNVLSSHLCLDLSAPSVFL